MRANRRQSEEDVSIFHISHKFQQDTPLGSFDPESVRRDSVSANSLLKSRNNNMRRTSNDTHAGKDPARKRHSLQLGADPFNNLRIKWSLLKYLHRLKSNVVLAALPSDKIQQQWHFKSNSDISAEESLWLLQREGRIFAGLSTLILIAYITMLWMLSVQTIFGTESVSFDPFLLYGFPFMVIDGLLAVNTQRIHKNMHIKNRKLIVERYFKKEVFVDASLLSCMAGVLTLQGRIKQMAQVIAMGILFYKVSQVMNSLLSHLESVIRKQYIKLFSSFGLLLVMGHCVSLVLYAATNMNPHFNWLNQGDFVEHNWFSDYIYSLYWAFTTIVTVGYGDIKPVNKYEMTLVIVIEILGSSVFGYMINVIGMTLTELKQQEEVHEATIKTAQKLNKCLGLDRSLAYRVKKYLSDNRVTDKYFNLDDQKLVVDKLSPALRNEIMKKTNSKVVNKCTFFLTYFNMRFLHEISLKLSKKLLQPGEELTYHTTDQIEMYIIDEGLLEVNFALTHKFARIAKKVNTISKTDRSQIGSNVYGYVALVTSKPNRLSAVSKAFTLAYYITRQKFLSIVKQDCINQQVVHELRHRFELEPIPESVEAPSLCDPARHFMHKRLQLISKERHNQSHQFRAEVIRYTQKMETRFSSGNKRQAQTRRATAILGTRRASVIGVLKALPIVNVATAPSEQKVDEVQKQPILNFESVKVYTNYYVEGNCDRVLDRYKVFRKRSVRENFFNLTFTNSMGSF